MKTISSFLLSARNVRYETGLDIFSLCGHTSETSCRSRDSYRLHNAACWGNSEISGEFIRYLWFTDWRSKLLPVLYWCLRHQFLSLDLFSFHWCSFSYHWNGVSAFNVMKNSDTFPHYQGTSNINVISAFVRMRKDPLSRYNFMYINNYLKWDGEYALQIPF